MPRRTIDSPVQAFRDDPVPAARGAGPLIQRDYWAVIENPRGRPSELIVLLKERFWQFAPEDLVRFVRIGAGESPLTVGDDLEVHIRMAGLCRVRVVHETEASITFATLPGHPEAGRITFGAYRNDRGDVVFHIRSRARSSSRTRRLGFLVGGEPMQTSTWTDFIDRFAVTVGTGIAGAIHAETRAVPEEREDRGAPNAPTYIAEAD